MHRKALFVASFALLMLPTVTVAQQPKPTPPPQGALSIVRGSRVRVSSPVFVTPLVANYLELRGDTLIFFEEGAGRGIWSVTLDQVRQLESSVGQRSRYRPYIIAGALIGGSIGAVGGLLMASTLDPSDPEKRYSRPLTTTLGALVGGGLGAYIGSRRTTEQWAAVRLPRRVSFGPDGYGAVRVWLGY